MSLDPQAPKFAHASTESRAAGRVAFRRRVDSLRAERAAHRMSELSEEQLATAVGEDFAAEATELGAVADHSTRRTDRLVVIAAIATMGALGLGFVMGRAAKSSDASEPQARK